MGDAVASMDYRTVTGHPFPAVFEDAEARWWPDSVLPPLAPDGRPAILGTKSVGHGLRLTQGFLTCV